MNSWKISQPHSNILNSAETVSFHAHFIYFFSWFFHQSSVWDNKFTQISRTLLRIHADFNTGGLNSLSDLLLSQTLCRSFRDRFKGSNYD